MLETVQTHKTGHTEAEKALWLVYVIQYTAEELEKPITETARLLNTYGFIKKVLDGYEAFHTQGFEYMAELLTSELQEAQRM
ncbi:MAG: DUF3791 domain-containing protein [Defluviitaleaceae bacterium]|nr:DUF3791 domain-containing protein [Defluviitaleaceae bacterium]